MSLVQFGEVSHYKCLSNEGVIGDSGVKWGMVLWFGVEARTGQHFMHDSHQEGIRHARTLMCLPDSQKLENDRAAAVSATLWSDHTANHPRGGFAEKTIQLADAKPDAVAKDRGV